MHLTDHIPMKKKILSFYCLFKNGVIAGVAPTAIVGCVVLWMSVKKIMDDKRRGNAGNDGV